MITLLKFLKNPQTFVRTVLAVAVLFSASSCSKDSLLPDARRAVLPTGDTISIDCADDDDDIPISSLPAAIVAAIETEFPGWEIDDVEFCDGGMGLMLYFIELENGGDDDDDRYVLYTEDGTRLEVFGDDDDDWDDWDDDYEYEYDDDDEFFISASGDTIAVDCDDDLPLSALPAAVTDAVAALYPDYSIEEAERCDASGLELFLLELENEADDEMYVGFDAAGNVYTYVDED
ncbi:MAG: hypothetical protein GC205_00235 [Bacteroidetes bacterium]|nr:hypothetical protein [Bacteroidota bacterium]